MLVTLGLRDLVVLCLCGGGVIYYIFRVHQKQPLPLPPSPFQWPLVGNAFQLPLTNVHLFYQELGRKLESKIISVKALGNSIIIINDAGIAKDLLEKRSAIYSSRPPLHMLEVVGTKQFFAFLPYGDEWRNQRRMFQQYFAPKNLPRVQDTILYFVRHGLLPNLFQSPEKYRDHVNGCIGGISISMTYGLPVQRNNDPLVHLSEEAFAAMTACGSPGKYLVNIMPILKYIPDWVPGARFKQVARHVGKQLNRVLEEPYEMTLRNIENGRDPGCFVSAMLMSYQGSPDPKENWEMYVKQTASTVFGATTESTMTVVMTFIMVMLRHPDIQRKVQSELDEVVGLDRLPDFPDLTESKLPYFSAVIKEVLRWNPVTPTGGPRQTTADDIYDGYFIPKGATIMYNTYAMLQDETIFGPNPRNFEPERFYKNGASVRDILDPTEVVTFGFGRRECPGSHIGLSGSRMIAASIISLFDIVPALGKDNEPIDFTPDFITASLVSIPLPFPCSFVPRKGRRVASLLEEYMGTDVL